MTQLVETSRVRGFMLVIIRADVAQVQTDAAVLKCYLTAQSTSQDSYEIGPLSLTEGGGIVCQAAKSVLFPLVIRA